MLHLSQLPILPDACLKINFTVIFLHKLHIWLYLLPTYLPNYLWCLWKPFRFQITNTYWVLCLLCFLYIWWQINFGFHSNSFFQCISHMGLPLEKYYYAPIGNLSCGVKVHLKLETTFSTKFIQPMILTIKFKGFFHFWNIQDLTFMLYIIYSPQLITINCLKLKKSLMDC